MALVQIPPAVTASTPANTAVYSSSEQSTSSSSYGNLSSSVTVTLTTGTKALILLSAQLDSSVTNGTGYASINVTGSSTISPTDGRGIAFRGGTGSSDATDKPVYTGHILYTNLTAGSNTFTVQIRTTSGTFKIAKISLSAVDMGS
jgi:hypothetical protein